MKRFSMVLVLIVLIGIGGGAVFLSTWDIPAPSAPVEIVVPDERFAQ